MSDSHSYAILFGDSRQRYLFYYLLKNGNAAVTYGLKEYDDIPASSSLEKALSRSDIILSPTPFTKDNLNLYSESGSSVQIENLLSLIQPEQILFGGNLPEHVKQYCSQKKITYYDYLKDAAVARKNAVATAEGAIKTAIENSVINLHKSRCMVLGFGKCGTVLAKKLAGLDACTIICARNPDALSFAESLGYYTCPLFEDNENELNESFIEQLKHADFIFNTVPCRILSAQILKEINKETILIDLASEPGGFDLFETSYLGLNAGRYPGLPGKCSPKTTAQILGDFILAKMKGR